MSDATKSLGSVDLTGRSLGDYHILRRLGAGGMAEVYLAEQKSLGRQVAFKVLQQSLASDATYVQRFLNEARAVAALVDPHIVQIHEVGERDGIRFIAQEYVAGRNLGQVLQREGALAPRLVLDVLRQVAGALAKASEMGIVHRDLKPENILLSHSGEVKVADFGLARIANSDAKTLTEVGVAMGTPLYMSPEQIEGRPVDGRSDIYSLGVTCYHLLSGQPPHSGETALAIALQHLNAPPRPLENVRADIPSALARIVHRMMAKKPEHRYQAPGELLADLRQLARDAAAEGWGDGPDQWTLAQWAASDLHGPTAQHLSTLMRASAQLDPGRRSRIQGVGAVLGGLALGVAWGAATLPRPYLATSQRPLVEVEARPSVWAQILHAKLMPSEESWRAVERHFPTADSLALDLANQGLIRYFLFSGEWGKAEPLVRSFRDRCESGGVADSLKSFTYASLCIVEQKLGRESEARQAAQSLDPTLRGELRQRDHQLYELLTTSLDALEK